MIYNSQIVVCWFWRTIEPVQNSFKTVWDKLNGYILSSMVCRDKHCEIHTFLFIVMIYNSGDNAER